MPAAEPVFALDRKAVRRAFDRAASTYDATASLARRVGAELLDRLQFFPLEPRVVLDLGAGTCQAAPELRRRFPRAQLIAIDHSPDMLRAAPRPRWPWQGSTSRICADARQLPLAPQSVDLVYSNLMLHWCDQPDAVFAEIARVLRPRGLLLFSTAGPDTLIELRSAWSEADRRGHVNLFLDLADLAAALTRAGFAEPVLDVEHYLQHGPDAVGILRQIRRLGSANALAERLRGLTGRGRFGAMVAAYERMRGPEGLPVTCEVICGAAFGGDAPRPSSGEFAVPVRSIRRAPGRN